MYKIHHYPSLYLLCLRCRRRHYVVTNTEVCACCFSLETITIELNLLHEIQNDLTLQAIT